MSANLVFRRAGLYQPSAFRQSRRQPSSGEERKAKSEKRYFDCAGKGKDTDVRTHAAVVPFPSTGGVDVSLHTLGPRETLITRDTAAAAIGMPLGRGGRKH